MIPHKIFHLADHPRVNGRILDHARAPVHLGDAVQGIEKVGMDAGPRPVGVEGAAVIVDGGGGLARFAQDLAHVAEGVGVKRNEVMYNDFVLVGPQSDSAGVKGLSEVRSALARIAGSKSLFASRGDDSGTHKAELGLWKAAGIDPVTASGTWYREMGAGMGATLNAATAMDAYALVDRATWTSFANKSGFTIVVEGDPALFNQYAVILVNSERHPHVKAILGREFLSWLLSPRGQSAIGSFEAHGQRLFVPNAARNPD